jgi:trans-aconitate methyltransferase
MSEAPLRIPIPPSEIRYRIVSEEISEEQFLRSGEGCAGDILKALSAAGIDSGKLENILDFGCGCSRVLRFMLPRLPQARFHGCDIDDVGIDWSRENLPGVEFSLVPHVPPASLPREHFDFIYALSVFSHLDLARQLLWFEELRQTLRPGGVLLVTVHGRAAYDKMKGKLKPWQQEAFESTGFVFVENITDQVLPDWYQTALYGESFARLVVQGRFAVLGYVARGMHDYQDVLLLQKQ